MIRTLVLIITGLILSLDLAVASPEQDREAFSTFYEKRFPDISVSEFIDGIYSIDQASKEQWLEIEEFAPYEFDIDAGEELYETEFANGKTYASCFGDNLTSVRSQYPRWDAEKQMVVTLELAINHCRVANGEPKLGYKTGEIAQISSYIAMQGRGEKINVIIPADDPDALAAYEKGKEFYYSKRGQLNFSCVDCHMTNVGNFIRADRLSPSLGHTSHFPVYRSKWGEIGTLHRRFTGCNRNIGAKPFAAQGEEYRNLEYFLSFMSNGLELNGPGSRK